MNKKIYCDNCGKILHIRESGEELFGECTCGFTKQLHHEFTSSEKMPKKAVLGTGVVKEEKVPGFPHICKKCGYDECDLDDIGASYADESDVYLYRCKKCGFVERQADGSGNK